MELAIGSTFDYEVPLERQLAALRQTTFSHVSLGGHEPHSGYLSHERQLVLLAQARQHGIIVDSLHAPFSTAYDLSKSDTERRMAAVCRVALCMAAAVELGCKTVILHLNSFAADDYHQDVDSLLHSLDALIESAENMQINLAAENLWGDKPLEFLRRSLAEFGSDRFGFCYDSSHDQLTGQEPYRILEDYADRLFAVHLSDNDGREDRHWLPFTGQVDWTRICQILRDSGFAEPLLLEVENSDGMETAEFLAQAAAAAERLREMIVS